jgi:hypothetical protein
MPLLVGCAGLALYPPDGTLGFGILFSAAFAYSELLFHVLTLSGQAATPNPRRERRDTKGEDAQDAAHRSAGSPSRLSEDADRSHRAPASWFWSGKIAARFLVFPAFAYAASLAAGRGPIDTLLFCAAALFVGAALEGVFGLAVAFSRSNMYLKSYTLITGFAARLFSIAIATAAAFALDALPDLHRCILSLSGFLLVLVLQGMYKNRSPAFREGKVGRGADRGGFSGRNGGLP